MTPALWTAAIMAGASGDNVAFLQPPSPRAVCVCDCCEAVFTRKGKYLEDNALRLLDAALDLAQVRERHEMHIVCVHLNKDKCQISMAPGSLHVR